MRSLFQIFSTRELSILIWISVVVIAMLFKKELRQSIGEILKQLFTGVIGIVLLLMIVYVSLLLFLLYKLHVWNFSLFKDTAFWFSSVALVLFFTMNKAKDHNYFREIVKENLKWTMFTEFVVNFYTFSIISELVFIPSIVLLGALQAFAATDKQYDQVGTVLRKTTLVIGAFIFLYVVYKTVRYYDQVFTIQNLFAFLLPPILTFLLIPFLYLLALYMNYEELFIHVRFMSNDEERKKLFRKQVLRTAHFNLAKLSLIRKKLNKFDFYHTDNFEGYVRSMIDKLL